MGGGGVGVGLGGVRVDVIGGVRWGVGLVGGGQGGCERRIEVLVKSKKKWGRGGSARGWVGSGGRVGDGQGGCERRIEVFGKNSQKKFGGGGGQEERGSGGGSGWWGGGGQGGFERNFGGRG